MSPSPSLPSRTESDRHGVTGARTELDRTGESVRASGILYTWTGSGKIVRTSMYWYVPVRTSTQNLDRYILVRTSMYEEHDMRVSHTPRQLSES